MRILATNARDPRGGLVDISGDWVRVEGVNGLLSIGLDAKMASFCTFTMEGRLSAFWVRHQETCYSRNSTSRSSSLK